MTIPFYPLLGIDFGPSAIKLAEVSGTGRKRKLTALGLELLPPNAIIDGVIQDQDAVEKALINLLDRLKINPVGRRAAFALSGSAVEVRRMLLDPTAGSLEQLARYEAEQHFQTDLNDLYFQFQELEGWSEDPAKVPVLMVGAQREPVDLMIDLLRTCGLRTGVVDCESLCLANIFGFNNPDSNALTAIVDVGFNSSSVTIVYNNHHLFTRSIALGGNEYSTQIMQHLGVDGENAEAMKLAACYSQTAIPDQMQRVFTDLNQAFAGELHVALKTYFDTSMPIPGVNGLSAIFLTGGGAKVIGLDETLSTAFQVSVRLFNPFSHIQVNPRQFELEYVLLQGHVFGVATGLALRKINDDRS